jgi:hypothetical protein
MIKMREAWCTLRVASASEINSLGHPTGWQNFSDAIVRGALPSKTAKGEAAEVVVEYGWASPRKNLGAEESRVRIRASL